MQEARASAAMVLTNHQLSKNTPEGINSLAPGKFEVNFRYRKTSGIIRALVGNKIVDNSDVVGASPVGAAPTTSSFST